MRPQAGVGRLKPAPPLHADDLPKVAQALSPANCTRVVFRVGILVVVLDIASQTTRSFIQSFFAAQRDHGFHETLHALPGRQLFEGVALAGAGFPGRRVAVDKAGVDFVPAVGAHETLVDLARSLLSVAHGVRDVTGAADQVAARVELAATGFQGVAVHFKRAVLLDAQAAGAQEILVHRLATGSQPARAGA